jgi:hypothetical protein
MLLISLISQNNGTPKRRVAVLSLYAYKNLKATVRTYLAAVLDLPLITSGKTCEPIVPGKKMVRVIGNDMVVGNWGVDEWW